MRNYQKHQCKYKSKKSYSGVSNIEWRGTIKICQSIPTNGDFRAEIYFRARFVVRVFHGDFTMVLSQEL